MREDDIHVVFGEQNARPLVPNDVRSQLHQRRALFWRHPCGWLVHEQNLGIMRQSNGQFHPLQIAVGQHRAVPVGLVGHIDHIQQRQRLRAIAAGGVGQKTH